MKKRLAALTTTILTLASMSAYAIKPGDTVKDFTLTDHQGKQQSLHDYKNRDAVVIMIQGNGCPIVRNMIQGYQELSDAYQDKNVAFLMLNANFQDTPKSVAKEAKEFGITLPILVDEKQDVGKYLELERTADIFVINTKNWVLEYRGELDDRLGYETQRVKASKHYAKNALDAVLAGKKPELSYTDAKGCLVNLIDD